MSNTDSNTKSRGTPIDGAVALVTGGNRGFGRAMVQELLDRGAAKVYATSRSPQPQTDSRIVPLVLDVTDDDSVAAAARAAAEVSIVVSNAGLSLRTPVLEAPLDEIRAELETNLLGRSALPGHSRRSSPAIPRARSSTSCRCSPGSRSAGARSAGATRSPRQRRGRPPTRCGSSGVTRAQP